MRLAPRWPPCGATGFLDQGSPPCSGVPYGPPSGPDGPLPMRIRYRGATPLNQTALGATCASLPPFQAKATRLFGFPTLCTLQAPQHRSGATLRQRRRLIAPPEHLERLRGADCGSGFRRKVGFRAIEGSEA
jgi:hypothetical protein